MVRTSPFHGGNMGSNPVGITNTNSLPLWEVFCIGNDYQQGFEYISYGFEPQFAGRREYAGRTLSPSEQGRRAISEPIPLGSPIQTAGCKKSALFYF